MLKKLLTSGMIILFLFCNIPFTTISDENNCNLNAKTLYVGGDGPGNYTKIQDAINDSSDGDTVFVYNGTYYESINIGNSIILQGEDKFSTIIDGRGILYNLIGIDKGDTHIFGFTVVNSSRSSGSSGITMSSSNNVISNTYIGIRVYGDKNYISNNIIENNYWGISLSANYNYIEENEIINNSNCGIYIQIDFYHDNVIRGNSFVGKTFRFGGLDVPKYNKIINNTVDGKLQVFLISETNKNINYEAGQIILMNCKNIQIKNQNISNINTGIELQNSKNCIV